MSFQLALLKPETRWRPPRLSSLPSLAKAKRISVDTETCDPDLMELGPGFRRGAYVAGVSLGIEDGPRFYLPLRHEGGGNVEDPERALGWLREELNSFKGEVVGAKLDYDLDALANEGVTFANACGFFDVQIAEALIDEWKLRYALAVLGQEYLGEGKVEDHLKALQVAHGFKAIGDLKRNLWRLSGTDVGEYAEGDADLPLRIRPLQLAKIEKDGLGQVNSIEQRLMPVLVAMRRRGVPISVPKAEQALGTLIRERDKWLLEVRRFAGPRAELLSAETLSACAKSRGLNLTYTKKKGEVQFDKAFFERNRDDKFAKALGAGRRANTAAIFVEQSLLGSQVKGRIHCSFNQLKGEDEDGKKRGTIARLSASDPNLQAVTKRESDLDDELDIGDGGMKSLVRGIFVPEPDHQWERLDLSQIQYRLLTHYARGPGAADARAAYLNDPKTSFHKLAAKIMGVDPEVTKFYDRIKNTNFAKVFNAGIDRVAYTFGCGRDEAQAFVDEYDRRLPFVKTTNRAAMDAASKNGYVRTVLGRVARFPNFEPRDFELRKKYGYKRGLPLEKARAVWGDVPLQRAFVHAALNRLLQGSEADVVKKAMVDCWEAGTMKVLGPFYLTVHDEFGYPVGTSREADQAAREVRRLTESAVELRVPVLADTKRGDDWGACS